jgi:hypothetical protein
MALSHAATPVVEVRVKSVNRPVFHGADGTSSRQCPFVRMASTRHLTAPLDGTGLLADRAIPAERQLARYWLLAFWQARSGLPP